MNINRKKRKRDHYDVNDKMIDDKEINDDRNMDGAYRRAADRQLNQRDRLLETLEEMKIYLVILVLIQTWIWPYK